MPALAKRRPCVISVEELQNMVRDTMQKRFLQVHGRTKATTPEEFYGFRAEDVVELHNHKQGARYGAWWRLKDGRVFDLAGRPSEPERHWYQSSTH
jgi:DMSO/TMAO reductase YedYZ molybdopterin-dependent catalytic subunit